MRRGGPAIIGMLVVASLLVVSGTAWAEQVRCDVLSIRASSDGSEVESSLEAYRSQLMRPPLNSFSSFHLAQTQQLRLRQGGAQPLSLGHGITGELRLVSTDAERGRLRLRLVLRRAGQTLVNSQVAVSLEHPFFVAGPIIPGGTLVVGIVCR